MPASRFANSTHANTLSLAATATATIGGSGTVLEVDNLANSGTVNLQNHTLLINYGSGADPIAAIKSEIVSGYAGGAWTGAGIDSSAAAASPASFRHRLRRRGRSGQSGGPGIGPD